MLKSPDHATHKEMQIAKQPREPRKTLIKVAVPAKNISAPIVSSEMPKPLLYIYHILVVI